MKKVSLNKRWKEILFAATGFGPNLLMVLMMAYFTDAVIPTGLQADVGFWSYGGQMIVSAIIFPVLWTIGRIFDGIVDVPLAAFTDNLKNKTGKRWISIVISVAPMIVSFILCWIPVFGMKDLSLAQQIGNSIWIFVWSIVFFSSYTLALITFYGALSDVCENQTQRARVSAYKSVFDTITYALAYAAIPAVFKAINVPIWQVAVFGSPIMLTIIIPLFMQSNVNDDKQVVNNDEKTVPIGESIVLTLKSKPFVKWLIVDCVAFFGLQMFLVAQNALISGVMNLGAGYAAILNTCAFAPVPLMLFLFNRLRKSKGLRISYQSALLSFAIAILGFCLGSQYFWGDNLLPKLLIGAVTGVVGSWGIGAFFMVPYLIPTSIASVEEEITGKNHSAMYFAIQALGTSIVGAIASSLIYNYLKLWVEHPENIDVAGADLGMRYGVSVVPLVVTVACVIGFFVCFLMPKRYTARTVYNDIKESAEKSVLRLERRSSLLKKAFDEKVLSIQNSSISENDKTILIENAKKDYDYKLAKINFQKSSYDGIINYKFDETHSIGNEEDRLLEKNSLFATGALFVLTGGLFGLVSLFNDIKKFRDSGIKLSTKEKVLCSLSALIPFLSIYTDIIFGKKYEELAKKHGIELNNYTTANIVLDCVLPLFMNPFSIVNRTRLFNIVSDQLLAEEKK